MTNEKGTGSGLSRRNFLLASSGTLGGAVLTLYGGSAHAKPARGRLGSIPNSYNFFRILTTDPNGISDFSAAVMLSSGPTSRLFFHGSSQLLPEGFQDGVGYAEVDFSVSPPRAGSLRASITQAVPLEPQEPPFFEGISQSMIQADRIGTGDTNALGHFATTIQTVDTGTTVQTSSSPGVYLHRPEDDTFVGVAFVGGPVVLADGTVGKYGSTFGDVSLCDDDTVVFTAAVIGPNGESCQALVAVPQADASRAQVQLQSGALLPRTNATLATFGLIDVASDDSFVVQATAALREPGADRRPGTAIISGKLRSSPSSYDTLAASPHLLPDRSGRHRDIAEGESHIGPRVARGGRVAHVMHTSSHYHQLMDNDRGHHGSELRRRVGESALGERGLSGPSIAAFSGPVISDDGELTYVTTLNDDGSSCLSVTDGVTTQVLLEGGVGAVPSGMVQGAVVNEILQGYHPTQVDPLGRIAFAAEFLKDASGDPNDSGNVEASIIVGIPA